MCVSFLFCNFGVEIMYYNMSLCIYVCVRYYFENFQDTFSLRME